MPLPLLLRLCALGIMAPALSEASQGQELHLSHSLPTSPSLAINGTWCSENACIRRSISPSIGLALKPPLYETLTQDITSRDIVNTMSNCDSGNMGLLKAVSYSQSIKDKQSSSLEADDLMHMLQNMQDQQSSRAYLPDVDMLSFNLEGNRRTNCEKEIGELKKKQHEYERRQARALRRIRQLRCRSLTTHTSNQVAKLVDHSYVKRRKADEDESNVNIKFNRELCDQIEDTTGNLSSQLKLAECWADSDATDSSSGGESCDEMEKYHKNYTENVHSNLPNIKQRALWKYAVERAAIASRWTWLQAQIADLECKIRQAEDLQRRVRATKGFVLLEEPQRRIHPSVSASDSNEQPSIPLDSEYAVEPSPALRLGDGYVGSPSRCSSSSDKAVNGIVMKASDEEDVTCVASRTRPVKTFRKRQLLRSAGLHKISKKASRHSTVACGCFPPVTSCIMCGGRVNNVASVKPHLSPVPDRIALIDNSYHSVLSFSKDVGLGVRVEHLLKGNYYQRGKVGKNSSPGRKPEKLEWLSGKTELDGARRKGRSLKADQRRTDDDRLKRKRHAAAQVANASIKRDRVSLVHRDSSMDSIDADEDEEQHSSRGTSPCPSIASNPPKNSYNNRRKKDQQASDIDNIVIPYSIASSTRLEKLEYKEIITPGWRIVDENVDDASKWKSSQDFEEFEDISDESYSLRHELCEIAEREKYFPNGRPNYPHIRNRGLSPVLDGWSPYMGDGLDNSPLGTPPSTPLSVSSDDLESSRKDRRRQLSRCASPEEDVQPFTLRLFPLKDEEYELMLEDNVHTPPHSLKSNQTSPSVSEDPSPVQDDPNDPEWTVDQNSRGKLVLKLTKR